MSHREHETKPKEEQEPEIEGKRKDPEDADKDAAELQHDDYDSKESSEDAGLQGGLRNASAHP